MAHTLGIAIGDLTLSLSLPFPLSPSLLPPPLSLFLTPACPLPLVLATNVLSGKNF